MNTHLGETCTAHKTYITCSNYCYIHIINLTKLYIFKISQIIIILVGANNYKNNSSAIYPTQIIEI